MQQLGVAQISATGDAGNAYDTNVRHLNDLLATAQGQRIQAEAQLRAVRGNTLNAADEDSAVSDVGLTTLKSNLNQRKSELMAKMNGLTPTNPLYIQNQQEIADIDGQLKASSSTVEKTVANRIELKYQAQVNSARSVEQQIEQELLAQTHQATTAAPKFQQAKELGKGDRPAAGELCRGRFAYPGSRTRKQLSPAPSIFPRRRWFRSSPRRAAPCCWRWPPCCSRCWRVWASRSPPTPSTPTSTPPTTSSTLIGFPPIGVLLDHDDFSNEASGQYLLRLAGGIQHARNSAGARTFLFTATASESGTTTVVEKLGRQLPQPGLEHPHRRRDQHRWQDCLCAQ